MEYRIKTELKTEWLGKQIHFLANVDSTNSWAKRQVKEGVKRGEVFLADYQTAGTGRENRQWESAAGKNILMSFIDTPPADESKIFQLTLVAGLGILSALQSYNSKLPFSLKWPNDILLAKKKMGGILCEHEGDQVVIGVGLNVNCRKQDFPSTITNTAVSLRDQTGKEESRERLIALCLHHYEKWRKTYDVQGIKPVLSSWKEKSMMFGKKVRIVESGHPYEGIAKDLDQDGFLLVEVDGHTTRVVAGDVIIQN